MISAIASASLITFAGTVNRNCLVVLKSPFTIVATAATVLFSPTIWTVPLFSITAVSEIFHEILELHTFGKELTKLNSVFI